MDSIHLPIIQNIALRILQFPSRMNPYIVKHVDSFSELLI